jgi:hypothetical protein
MGVFGLFAYVLFLYSLVWLDTPLWYFCSSLPWLFLSGLLVTWESPNFSWQIKGNRKGLLGAELDNSDFSGDSGCD